MIALFHWQRLYLWNICAAVEGRMHQHHVEVLSTYLYVVQRWYHRW
jgi:hypothetical protein